MAITKKKVAPRLFVIFAKEAREAIIFRRGPAAWYHLIRWDTKNDIFYPGAWVRGRIYPERCDLSPDGELLLYFIHQGRKIGTDYNDSWNAISRSPWLTAIGLWPQGTTYGGGGRFTDNRTATLRFYPMKPHPDHLREGLYINFLAGDTSFYSKEDQLPTHKSSNEREGAEWTGRDQRGRLIYTMAGKIMCSVEEKGQEVKTICLADLNDLTPDPQPAPPYAAAPLKFPKSKRRSKRTKSKLSKISKILAAPSKKPK